MIASITSRVLVRGGEDEHPGQRRDRGHLPDRLDAAHPRHVQVHHDDVGGEQRRSRRAPPRAGPRLADHVDLLRFEQGPQPLPEQVVVVDEQDSWRRRCGGPCGSANSNARTPFPVGQRIVSLVDVDRDGSPAPGVRPAPRSGTRGRSSSPTTAAAGVGRDGLAVARNDHVGAERDHRRVDRGDAPADRQPRRGVARQVVGGRADGERAVAARRQASDGDRRAGEGS